MDENYDFRPYLETLLRRWRLLLGGTLLAGILAVGLSFLLPPTYEGNALVLVVAPSQIVQFDPRFEAVDENRPLQAYPQLATSDTILQTLLAQITPEVAEPDTLNGLREIIAVSAANDPSLLRLTVRHSDAAAAALIANRWAELFIAHTNRVLGDQSSEQVQFYSSQRDNARRHLDAAELALTDFQATNQERIVAAELLALENSLAAYLIEQRDVELLQRDVVALRAQLAMQEDTLLPADQLAILLLYARVFGGEQPSPPVELQIGGDLSTTANRSQFISTLDGLLTTLETVADGITDQITPLEPQILTLQQQLQTLTTKAERLKQEVVLATETYTALERQVAAEGITSQDASRGLRLASPASIPERPVAPQAWLNGILAAVVALIALVAATLFRQWRSL